MAQTKKTELFIYIKTIFLYLISIIVVAVIINSSVLGIADIVIAKLFADSPCHITHLGIYLYIYGTFALINMVFVLFIDKDKTCLKVLWVIVTTIMLSLSCWGMSLVWNTNRGNCPEIYYNYAYYRTVIYMFLGIVCLCIAVIVSLINCYSYITTCDKLASQITLDEKDKKIFAQIDTIIKNMNSTTVTNANTMESVV